MFAKGSPKGAVAGASAGETGATIALTADKRPASLLSRLILFAPALVALGACETMPRMTVASAHPSDANRQQAGTAGAPKLTKEERALATRIDRLSSPPTAVNPPAIDNGPETAKQLASLFPKNDRMERTTLPPQAVPQFIDTVFNDILKVPYSMGPGVAEMRQVVAVRGAVDVDQRTFFAMVEMALRDYGVSLQIENGVVRVSRNESLIAGAPQIIRSRSFPETPDDNRAVIQFFELQSVEATTLKGLLDEMFPNLGGVKISVRQDLNSLVIVGRARDVQTASQVISQFDQPQLAGAQIARIEPVYWQVDKLASAVTQALQAEGYQATTTVSPLARRTVTFMTVPFSNQVILFSSNPEAFDRALYWVKELDRPSSLGDSVGTFVYNVKNTSAEELAQIAGSVSGDSANTIRPPGGAQPPVGVPGNDPRGQQQPQPGVGGASAGGGVGSRITADSGNNRLIYRGTPSEFERARQLFEQLDTPPLQVLIEITIAEVTLNDETRFGLEWFAEKALNVGLISGGTEKGLGLSGGGLTIEYDHGTVRSALNAFASNNNINVLSSPRVVARSGGEARIQVGTDVPIITSQRASNQQTSGSSDILQSVQYRQTGVITTVKPTVFGDRVEIDVNQEVSSQADNPNAAIASPLILNRSITTALTVREGSTAVIGGLMQDNYTRGNTGVPVLKDIPLIGQAFRTDKVSGDKTELLMLVTPHIIRSDDQLADAASYYADSINDKFSYRGPHAFTLLPWHNVFDASPSRAGSLLPSTGNIGSAPVTALSSPPPQAQPAPAAAEAQPNPGPSAAESPPAAPAAAPPASSGVKPKAG